jgi:hypothetical protein
MVGLTLCGLPSELTLSSMAVYTAKKAYPGLGFTLNRDSKAAVLNISVTEPSVTPNTMNMSRPIWPYRFLLRINTGLQRYGISGV